MFDCDKKILIGMAKGGAKNIRVGTRSRSFREFGEFCSKVQQGGKHDNYFLRGCPEVEEKYVSGSGTEYGEGRFRHDKGITKGDFLVIDADHSKVPPLFCSAALDELNLCHFLYTSHSHSADSNNYRVVIPCEISDKKNLEGTCLQLVADINNTELLRGKKIGLKYVREMGVWSQAWYFPTRDDIEDGLFVYSKRMEGNEYQEIIAEDKKAQTTDTAKIEKTSAIDNASSSPNINETIDIIQKGKEGLHHAIRDYSNAKIKDGMNENECIHLIRTLMSGLDMTDSRILNRFNDIERIVKGADKEESSEEKDGTLHLRFSDGNEEKKKHRELEWPPGLMGQFARDMYNSAQLPNKTMCCTAVMAIIAGIIGRRNNINGLGLNLSITYLAPTGFGKDYIGNFCKHIMNKHNKDLLEGQNLFLYSSEFTGPKALLDEVNEKRCGLILSTESGYNRMKQSGDQISLDGCRLTLATSSGRGKSINAHAYSDKKNNTKLIPEPCVSGIEESTPDVYLNALKDGHATGTFNRMSIFRLRKHTSNEMNILGGVITIDEVVQEKVIQLMSFAKNYQQKHDPHTSHYVPNSDMVAFYKKCMDEADKLEGIDKAKHAMLQRSHEKAWKYACIITIFNSIGYKDGPIEGLEIDDDAWKWAERLHEYEMEGLDRFFVTSNSNSFDAIILDYILIPIIKLLEMKGSPYKKYSGKTRLSVMDIKMGRIPVSVIREVLRKCEAINKMSKTGFGKDGFSVMLKYMEDAGYIRIQKGKVRYIIVRDELFANFKIDRKGNNIKL